MLPYEFTSGAFLFSDFFVELTFNNEVLGRKDAEAKLKELEQSPELWKDKIIHEELYQLIDEPLQQALSYCLVYQLRVPMVALEAVCDCQQHLQRGLDLGLIEMSPESEEQARVYRVSRILPHIIPNIRLPEAPTVYSLYRKAHDKLHELWGSTENRSEEKWREIFRLLFVDRDNPLRFRQGFSQMLAVQYNSEADIALESELKQLKDELPKENFYSQLENYLRQGDWREADEETAWLFYLVMVKQDYKNWDELCNKFPSETIKEIDRLWDKYSKEHFGFTIQKRIWEREWFTSNDWKKMPFCKLPFSLSPEGFIVFRARVLWGWWWGRERWWTLKGMFLRFGYLLRLWTELKVLLFRLEVNQLRSLKPSFSRRILKNIHLKGGGGGGHCW